MPQIYAGMWVRNGIQIKGQAMTYIQCHFCYSMADLDIYLLQVCVDTMAGREPVTAIQGGGRGRKYGDTCKRRFLQFEVGIKRFVVPGSV